jgi:cyclopropane-fatty-acyl-phospholipid synthase
MAIPQGVLTIDDGRNIKSFGTKKSQNDVCATMHIHDSSAFEDICLGGTIGAAEAYMQGKWSSPNLVNLVRLMSINISYLHDLDGTTSLIKRLSNAALHWINRNTSTKAKKNIAAHYDLGNEFFDLFLDPEMMYSSAIFPHSDAGLDEAAVYKLDVICKKLDLTESDRLLEIGSGWGGMAIYAAKNYGCHVTTTTISKQQYQEATRRVKAAGLEDKVTILFEDYRDLEGCYDKLVSVEMIEAVGHEFYPQYFKKCASLLKSDGLMLLQAITIPDQRFNDAQNSVDFIQRYIFPGGSLPGHEIMMSSIKKYTDMQMVGMQEIGTDYAKTLSIWRERFLSKLDQTKALGFDNVFIRMWDYYLCYCQGAFTERVIGATQILFAKPGWRRSGEQTPY